ncbi:hypothetical protein [Jannaschia marina]|uniref:hypothetical protein n=1 Tax=Jannaschia marina TaxID=2741674 RepID=UPI0015CD59E2|nr:hypothetical protein [Jannaschia marina]
MPDTIEDVTAVTPEDGGHGEEIVVTATPEPDSFFNVDSFDFWDFGPGESVLRQYDHDLGVGRQIVIAPDGTRMFQYFEHSETEPHVHDVPRDVIFMGEPDNVYDLY